MKVKQIFFTGKGKAELLDSEIDPIKDSEVLIESVYIPISAGTERANLMRMPNTGSFNLAEGERGWGGGYSCAGIIKEVGQNVKSVSVGDKVLAFWSENRSYNVVPEENVIRLPDKSLYLKHAAFAFIASFSAAAIRKTRLEFGESAMVFGLGILGAFAVKLLRIAGAFPLLWRI
jgi:NADPH:quinone reductase-like Zn-dependent oxidoreductase